MIIKETIDRLGNRINDLIKRLSRRLTRNLIIQAAILVLVVIYMGWAYGKFTQIDADSLVVELQNTVSQELPALSDQIADRLNAYAPELMEKLKDKIISVIPLMGQKIENEVNAAMKAVCNDCKEKISGIGEFLKQQKAIIDQKQAQLNDKEKLGLLMKDLRQELKTKVRLSTDTIKADYSRRMSEINLQLEHLTLDDANLTEKEILQKRLLEVWLKLVRSKANNIIIK